MLGAPDLSALISSAGVWSPAERAASREYVARFGRSPGFLLALLFLLVNFVARFDALRSTGLPATLLGVVVVLAAVACLLRPAWLGPALAAFGSSFFLYGFHSYSTRNQAFELVLTALAVVLVLRLLLGPQARVPTAMPAVLPFAVLYALAATFSLLQLPPRVLEHRAFLEGGHLAQALLTAFPKDPLYPIASVNRLWLFLTFAVALSAQARGGHTLPPARPRHRLGGDRGSRAGSPGLRGRAVARALQPVAGLLRRRVPAAAVDFRQPRLVRLLRGLRRTLHAAGMERAAPPGCAWCSRPSFPLTAASLFLSGARASWLAGLGMLAGPRCPEVHRPPAGSASGPRRALSTRRCSPRRSPSSRSWLSSRPDWPRRLRIARLRPSGSKASRARSALEVSASRLRGAWRPSTPSSSHERDLSSASATRASTCTCALSSRCPARRSRASSTRPSSRTRPRRCSTTATTRTSRCSPGPACSGSCSGSRSWPHHSRSRCARSLARPRRSRSRWRSGC